MHRRTLRQTQPSLPHALRFLKRRATTWPGFRRYTLERAGISIFGSLAARIGEDSQAAIGDPAIKIECEHFTLALRSQRRGSSPLLCRPELDSRFLRHFSLAQPYF
jgi:hypothetical protein